MSLLKELTVRAKLETPHFFKQLAAWLVALSIITGSTLAGDSMLSQYYKIELFPEWTIVVFKHITFAGFCCSAICKLAVTKPEDIHKPG